MTKEEQQKFAEEELLNSKRIFKSATPKYDLSWYVKWASSILILIALTIGADYPRIWDMWFGFFGMIGWTWVGFLWKDRAILVLNVVSTPCWRLVC